MASVTLNQVVKTIQDIAQAHKQIKTVFYGNLLEFLSKGSDNVYPAMFFDINNSSLTPRVLTVSFSLYFFDRMLPERTNELEVLSDTLSIAQDICAQLKYEYFDFEMQDSVNLTFFTEDTPDLLAGVKADITIEMPYLVDRCQVPSSYQYPS